MAKVEPNSQNVIKKGKSMNCKKMLKYVDAYGVPVSLTYKNEP